MSWVKLSDDFNEHPKSIKAGPLAQLLYLRAIIYSSRYLTDGFIAHEVVRSLVDWGADEVGEGGLSGPEPGSFIGPAPVPVDNYELAERLLASGLWEPSPGGFLIHDYHKYNPAKKDVLALRKLRSKAGRQGGIKSGVKRRSKNEAKSNPVPPPLPLPIRQIPNSSEGDKAESPLPAPPAARKSPELTSDERQACKSATNVIEALEKDPRLDGFNPGAWWGKGVSMGRHRIPMLQALLQLSIFIRTNRVPPNKPWAYLEDTYREKEGNYYALRAEQESASRRDPMRRENGNG